MAEEVIHLIRYIWDQGPGSDSTVKTTPATTTTYRLILDDNCTVKSDTVFTTVYVRPPLELDISNDTLICIGANVKLEAKGTDGDSTYRYSWDNGLGNGSSHIISPLVTTTYQVNLEDDCSPGIQKSVTVSVENNPVVNFTVDPAQVCEGYPISFTNLTVGNYSYIWRFGDQQVSNQASPEHIYQQPGLFSVRLVATSTLGCRDSFTVNNAIEIYPDPKASFTAEPGTADILKPLIHFKNNSLLADNYLWDFGDLSSSTDKDPKHLYMDSGWYPVALYVTSANNCTDTAYDRIRINDYYRIFVPTAFSPNGDQINDVFEVKGRGIAKYHISIYNRWGELVFESFDITQSWDGRLPNQSRPSPDNLYNYMIDLADITQERHFYQGNIVLLQ